jgi:HPt (histidine-containing phosphotransfer) domain-containing protein
MLNWQRVQDLKDDLGQEDFDEIVDLFLEEVEEKLEVLQNGRTDGVSAELHFLKGSAANLGFESFRVSCEQMERAPEQFEVDELLSVYKSSKAAFMEGTKA